MNMIERRRRMMGQGGFTLIELLVVIAILGILAGVVVFAVGNTTDGAANSACKVEKSTLQTANAAAKAKGSPNLPSDYVDSPSIASGYVIGKYFAVSNDAGGTSYALSAITASNPGGTCTNAK